MDELRPDDVAARVAAWHNRHPLARRITPAQVQGVGWVALPFAAKPGAAALSGDGLPTLADPLDALPPVANGAPASATPPAGPRLRDRAQARAASGSAAEGRPGAAPTGVRRLLAGAQAALRQLLAGPARLRTAWQAALAGQRRSRARQRALRPAYSEDFIAPLSPARTARWALRHGQLHPRLADLPLRQVQADTATAQAESGLTHLYLATAAVEAGPRRVRLLLGPVGPGGSLQAIGPRLYSRQRGAALLGALLLAAGGLAAPVWMPASPLAALAALPSWSSLPPVTQWPGVQGVHALVQRVLQRSADGQAYPALAQAAGAAASAAGLDPHAAASAAAGPEAAALAAALAGQAPASDALGADAQAADAQAAASAAEASQALAAGAAAWAASAALAGAAAPLAPETASGAHATPAAPAGHRMADAATRTPAAPATATPGSPLPPDDPPPQAAAPAKGPWVRPLVAPLDEATKAAARQTVADLRAARGDPPAPLPPLASSPAQAAAPRNGAAAVPAVAQGASPGADAVATAADIGPSFALTTRPLRTRAESEQVQAAVRALLDTHTREPVLVELMPAGDDWRVVCWPFPRRQDAQLARALLLTRGLRLEAVEF